MWEAATVILIGCGVIAALMKLNHTVGKLCNEVKHLANTLADHEKRIRDLEKE